MNAAQAIASAVAGTDRRGCIVVRTERDGPDAVISVTDTGEGIAPDIRARVFDPFFTTKPVGRGAGLGLSLARGIVEKHGGTLTFETEVGCGTRFTVRTPVNLSGTVDSTGRL